MKVGDKVIIKKEICANNLKNPWFNAIATVIKEPDRFGLVKVKMDDFPNVNHREHHNQFYYNIDELEALSAEN